MTGDAVRAFQSTHSLSEDGVVGEETWSALVDATFTLGDRMLYLRSPFFHGSDVLALQQGLNTLGFWCGDPDGIFGPFTERGVREFQRSCGQGDDGIAGMETVGALTSLRHVWEGKDARTPTSAKVEASRSAAVLSRVSIALAAEDATAADVADRVANLALAANESARVMVVEDPASPEPDTLVLRLTLGESDSQGATVVLDEDTAATSSRIMTALSVAASSPFGLVIELPQDVAGEERERQRAAVRLLDAVCLALS